MRRMISLAQALPPGRRAVWAASRGEHRCVNRDFLFPGGRLVAIETTRLFDMALDDGAVLTLSKILANQALRPIDRCQATWPGSSGKWPASSRPDGVPSAGSRRRPEFWPGGDVRLDGFATERASTMI